VGVPPGSLVGLEHGELVPPSQQLHAGDPGHTRADHCDPHRRFLLFVLAPSSGRP